MARPQFLVILRPARPTFPGDATDEELAVVSRHFEHLQRHHREGRVILAGRTQEDADPIGLLILQTDDPDEARRLVETDPAVASGLFTAETRPYQVALHGTPDAQDETHER